MPGPVIERATTSLRLRGRDAADLLRGRRDRLVPPRRLDFVGHSDFAATGDEFLGHFVKLGGLQPFERVLDVGCGIGRMARPLSAHLGVQGSYEGFDVNRTGIGWCRRRYKRHPNFHFRVADLYNARYNPGGEHTAADYRFPFADGAFDFVIMTSVLTHLLESDCEHYLAEATRVLAPGGRVFATFFLLNDTSRALIASGKAGLPFLDPQERIAVVSEELPEEAVAYDDAWVFETLRAQGLDLTGIHPGSWCGRDEFVSFQDIVVATRDA